MFLLHGSLRSARDVAHPWTWSHRAAQAGSGADSFQAVFVCSVISFSPGFFANSLLRWCSFLKKEVGHVGEDRSSFFPPCPARACVLALSCLLQALFAPSLYFLGTCPARLFCLVRPSLFCEVGRASVLLQLDLWARQSDPPVKRELQMPAIQKGISLVVKKRSRFPKAFKFLNLV